MSNLDSCIMYYKYDGQKIDPRSTVRQTGGLIDTVEPYNKLEGTGTGFGFLNYNAHEMLGTIREAEHVYYDQKREWNKMIDRAMAVDFSWKVSAEKYQEMYDWLRP